jgi:hypothetical protein
MMLKRLSTARLATLGLVAFALGSACGNESDEFAHRSELILECLDEGASSDTPLCPPAVTLECGSEQDVAIAVNPPAGTLCANTTLEHSLAPPYPLGTHDLVVTASDSSGATLGEVCSTSVTVQDSLPPQGTDNGMQLWPPNHKMVTIDVAACVSIVDSCDADVKVAFTRVTSNEVFDGQGDGHHSPDIEVFDCNRVDVRRERSGQGGGRVYTFDWVAQDAAGNESTGTCTVGVAHDQSKKGKKTPATEATVVIDIDPSDCIDTPPGDDGDDETTTDTTGTTSTDTTSTDTNTPPG